MSMTIDQMCADTVKREGGFNIIAGDNGGATNCGISLTFAKSLAKVNGRSPMDLNHDGVVDVRDIHLVTPAIAAALFKSEFYVKTRVAELPAPIQPVIFDMDVNGGPGGGAHVLEMSLNTLGYRVLNDGRIKDNDISSAAKAFAKVGATFFLKTIVRERIAYYQAIAAHNPHDVQFLKGWINRANEFLPS